MLTCPAPDRNVARKGGIERENCFTLVLSTLPGSCFVTAGHASAQAVAGSQLSGVVRDASGGVLPGAEVTVTKTDTGAIRTVVHRR